MLGECAYSRACGQINALDGPYSGQAESLSNLFRRSQYRILNLLVDLT